MGEKKMCSLIWFVIVSLFSPFLFGFGNSGDDKFLVYLVITLLVLCVFFFIFREIMCWYFKINERISKLDKIIQLLEKSNLSTSIQSSNTGNKVAAESSSNNFVSMKDAKDSEAFCAGCRSTDSIRNLFHDKSRDLYYHEKCLPK